VNKRIRLWIVVVAVVGAVLIGVGFAVFVAPKGMGADAAVVKSDPQANVPASVALSADGRRLALEIDWDDELHKAVGTDRFTARVMAGTQEIEQQQWTESRPDVDVLELAFDEADELITVITMRERKLLMETRADAFVTLPGGFGTLEEFIEILTLRQLHVVKKPCVFFNQDGFYDDLLRLFDKMLAEKFFKPSNMDLFRVANTVEDVFSQIELASDAKLEPKWFDTR
jgi:uncharacterized protein (TIGR00730 family)